MDDTMRIGVFTKCDRADDTEDEELGLPFAELRDRILQKKSAGCEPLVARGYIGTMIKPPKVLQAGPGGAGAAAAAAAAGSSISEQHQSNLGRIRQEAINETSWFRRNGMGDSRDIARLAMSTSSSPHGSSVCGRVGCNDLVDHIEAMYLNYVSVGIYFMCNECPLDALRPTLGARNSLACKPHMHGISSTINNNHNRSRRRGCQRRSRSCERRKIGSTS